MRQWNKNLMYSRLSSVVISLMLSACSVPFLNGMSTEEFAAYVEQVFKLQNSMTTQIMALGDEEEKPKNFDAILQSEQQMQKQCAALNEYATRDIDGVEVDLALKTRVADSAKTCEAAAKNTQKLLPKSVN